MSQNRHHRLSRTVIATALIAGCGHSATPSANAVSPPASTASADGSVAPANAAGVGGPRDSISALADRGRILGDATATVWVVMASDFQCPFCKTWHDAAFRRLMATYVKTGRVRLAFLNMPLSMHPNAVPAAEAAMCASVQNKFWEMHEALFATQAAWETMPDPRPKFDSLATAYGVDMAPWRQCVAEHLTRPLIQADHDRATATGVNSTPTFFVDGYKLSGADADLAPAIDAALAKNGKKPAS